MDGPTGRERVAALVALLTLAAAVVGLVVGVVQNWAGVALALVAVFVLVTSAWSVVSRRGAAQISARAVAAGSVGLLVWGLVIAHPSLLRIAAIAILAVASVGCARIALRNVTWAFSAEREVQRAGKARHPVLIMNPKSGGGKAERYHLVDECRARGIEPIVLQPGDDLMQVAAAAVARGADVIGMAGGDGSQALVAAVTAWHSIPHVVVPAGTRNHFALDLGLDRDNVVAALDAFTDGVERRIDLADVNGRVFVNNASLGLYARVVQSPGYRDAKLKTAASVLPSLAGPDSKPLDLRFTGPDDAEYLGNHLILVSNDPYQLDHIGGRGTREKLDCGTLGVAAARIDDATDASQFIALEEAGQVRRFNGWLEWETNRFEVGSDSPVEIALDGESLVMAPPLLFTSRHAALKVRLPRQGRGVSPTVKALDLASRATIAELVATAAGRGIG
jgi:diacylglycerol kinase family enzyme